MPEFLSGDELSGQILVVQPAVLFMPTAIIASHFCGGLTDDANGSIATVALRRVCCHQASA
jgi:hypothetical protein